jgi:ABC-type lipoprotein export system ATPase subunit
MLLETRDLHRTHLRGEQQVHALRGVSLQVHAGEFVSIVGPSGSGKSTLLHLIGGLDRPTRGSVLFEGRPLEAMTDAQLAAFRRRRLGFVFQFFHLMPTLSAEENVALPLLLDGQARGAVLSRARELLDAIGLQGRHGHRPGQLSGGELQRVAIARALIAKPLLVVADEPTGNLDSATGQATMQMLRELVVQTKQTLVLVTHDARAASFGDRVVTMRDGCIVGSEPRSGAVGEGPRA